MGVTTIFLLQIFNASSGRGDIVKHNLLEIEVARFIRFQPLEFSLGIGLRVELYGVIAPGGTAFLSSLLFVYMNNLYLMTNVSEFHAYTVD